MDEQIRPVAFVIFTGRKKPDVEWIAKEVERGQKLYSQQSIDALRAEVEFHKLDASALRSQMDVLRDGLASERERAESLRADAERYRWLRCRWGRLSESYDGDTDKITAIFTECQNGWDVHPESLDAAIDAARKGAE